MRPVTVLVASRVFTPTHDLVMHVADHPCRLMRPGFSTVEHAVANECLRVMGQLIDVHRTTRLLSELLIHRLGCDGVT